LDFIVTKMIYVWGGIKKMQVELPVHVGCYEIQTLWNHFSPKEEIVV